MPEESQSSLGDGNGGCNYFCVASFFGHGFHCLAVRFVQRGGEGDGMACVAVVEGGVAWDEGILVCLCLVELKGMGKLINVNLSDGVCLC